MSARLSISNTDANNCSTSHYTAGAYVGVGSQYQCYHDQQEEAYSNFSYRQVLMAWGPACEADETSVIRHLTAAQLAMTEAVVSSAPYC